MCSRDQKINRSHLSDSSLCSPIIERGTSLQDAGFVVVKTVFTLEILPGVLSLRIRRMNCSDANFIILYSYSVLLIIAFILRVYHYLYRGRHILTYLLILCNCKVLCSNYLIIYVIYAAIPYVLQQVRIVYFTGILQVLGDA